MTKNYDPAAWKAQKDDQLKQAQEAVLQIAENFHRDPTQIAEMLAFQSRFHSYSIRNSMLIYASNPHATFTASFAHFKSMGWSVQKGQKGTQILVPARVTYIQDGAKWVQLSKASKRLQAEYHEGKIPHKSVLRFKVGYVFDISQTDCPPEQYPKIFSMGQSSEDHKAAYEGLVEWSADRLKCPVKIEDVNSISLFGFYTPSKNTITLSDKLNDTQLFSTCLHEVAHAILHNSPDAMAKPTAQIEFEADALSVMLETHAGIELTEARKGHLADNYREMVSALPDEAKVDEILQPVAEIYKNMVGEIEAAITKYVNEQNVVVGENSPAEHEEAPVTAEELPDEVMSPEVVLERMTYSKLAMFAPAVMNGTYDTEIFESGVDEISITRTADRLTFSRYDLISNSDPVARIDYLSADGSVGYSVSYKTEAEFLRAVNEDLYYGVPLKIVLYRNETGNTISKSFLEDIDTLPKGLSEEPTPSQISYDPRIEFAVDDELRTLRPLSYENTEQQTKIEVTDNSMRTQLDLYIHKELFPTMQGFVPYMAEANGQNIDLYPDGTPVGEPSAPQIEAAPIMEM